MSSIRIFLTSTIVAIVILANFIAAILGYQKSMEEAELLFDHKLVNVAEILATFRSNPALTVKPVPVNQTSVSEHILYQVRDDNNQIIFQSKELSKDFTFQLKKSDDHQNYQNIRWRTLTRYFDAQKRWVFIMENQDVRYKLAESVILQSVYPIVLAILIIVLLSFFIIRLGLKPLHHLAQSVERKKAGNLTPISLDNVPSELSGLTVQVNELLFRIEHSLDREKQFASNVAHELRTPLAVLNIQLNNLKHDDVTGSEQYEELRVVVRRMNHLVEQILVLNKSASNDLVDQFQRIDLRLLLKNIAAELYPLIEEKKHQLEFEYDEENDYYIEGDQFSLESLFKNLIGNAIKFTPENGHVQLRLTHTKQRISVSVMDSGPGISAENWRKIFNRFYRVVDHQTDKKIVGAGLGLSIVKQIVELHHAKIKLSDSQFVTLSGESISNGLTIELIFERLAKGS